MSKLEFCIETIKQLKQDAMNGIANGQKPTTDEANAIIAASFALLAAIEEEKKVA